MIIPVRCFSCGKVSAHPINLHRELRKQANHNISRKQVVGDLWTKYVKLIETGGPEGTGIDEGYVFKSAKRADMIEEVMRAY